MEVLIDNCTSKLAKPIYQYAYRSLTFYFDPRSLIHLISVTLDVNKHQVYVLTRQETKG